MNICDEHTRNMSNKICYVVLIVSCVICSHVYGKTSRGCHTTFDSDCVLNEKVKVKNELKTKHRSDVTFKVANKSPPKIQKTAHEIMVLRNQSANISCRITEGVRHVNMRWFFKNLHASDFIEIDEISDVLRIPAADVDKAGTYRCEAYNVYGEDSNEIDFIVEYPPSIKDHQKSIKAVDGKDVYLHCVVDGFPPPHVYWSFNGVILGNSFRQRVLRNNTLRITGTVADTGNYVCEAVNRLGSARKTVQVVVHVPPKIKPPPETTITRDIGSFLILHCEASGTPKPTITWLFFSSDTKKEWRAKDNPGVLYLPRLLMWDSGYYVCIAKNSGGSANVTFSLELLAPPSIRKAYKPKSLKAFIGDIFVELPCLANGNPKPTITWFKNGVNIKSGKNWHDIKRDGTLIIKYVDDTANATYRCIAKNEKGFDTDEIHVSALPFPKQKPTRTVYLEVEEPAKLNCDISHKKSDIIRWYKNSKIVTIGELSFDSVKVSDRGLYTCRVYSFFYDVNVTISVRVGFKPMFLSSVHQDLDFKSGERAYLPCVARGHPYPKVKWQHDGKTINQINMVHSFIMAEENMGQYTCVVSNELGSITRNFTIFQHRENIESATRIIDEN